MNCTQWEKTKIAFVFLHGLMSFLAIYFYLTTEKWPQQCWLEADSQKPASLKFFRFLLLSSTKKPKQMDTLVFFPSWFWFSFWMFRPTMSNLGWFHGGSNQVFAPFSRGFTLLERFNYCVPKRASPPFQNEKRKSKTSQLVRIPRSPHFSNLYIKCTISTWSKDDFQGKKNLLSRSADNNPPL